MLSTHARTVAVVFSFFLSLAGLRVGGFFLRPDRSEGFGLRLRFSLDRRGEVCWLRAFFEIVDFWVGLIWFVIAVWIGKIGRRFLKWRVLSI